MLAVLALSKPDEVAARLGSWLRQRNGDTVVVLDDLHTVTNLDFHAGLVELVAAAGDRLHLVAVTRHDPPWPLHRLRADGMLHDLRADALAFDAGEAETLFALLDIGVDAQGIGDLVTRTEGWVAGLRLAAIGATTAADPARFVEAVSGRSGYIADYLMREVFERLDQAWRDFLARIAVVDDICGELAEALGAGSDSEFRLGELVRQNAFIHQLGDRLGWYRLHPLLLDFLRSRVTNAQQQRTLHSRAAGWFRDQGEPLTALQHSIAAEDWGLVDDLVGTHVVTWTVCQPPAELQRLLAPVPREEILTRPGLAIGFAAALAMQGQPGGVAELVAAAQARVNDSTGQRRRRYQLLLEVIVVGTRRWHGDLQAVLDGYRRMPTDPSVLGVLGLADWVAVRTLLIGNRGVCELWLGESSAAIEHLVEAARLDGNRSLTLPTLNAQSHLAYLHWANGDLTAALDLGDSAVAAFAELQIPGAVQARCAYLALAGVAVDRDEPDAARRWLQIARQGASEPHTAFATELMSARLSAADDKPFEAISALRDLRERTADLAIGRQLIEQSLRLEGRLLELVENTAAAQTVTASIQPAPPGEETLRGRVEHHLDEARQALTTGSQQQALDELERALVLAAPERLRRPFLTSGNDVRRLLSVRVTLGTEDPAFVADLAHRAAGQAKASRSTARVFVPLTERETNVLHYLATTLPASEIAATLYVSMNTVKTHQRSIYGKLGAGGRREAVAHARELGLI